MGGVEREVVGAMTTAASRGCKAVWILGRVDVRREPA